MKKLKLISAIAIASLTLFSCSNNDDDDSSNASIEGLWKIHELRYNDIPQPLTDCDDKQTLEFTATQTIAKYYSGPNCDELDETETSAYSLDGNTITVTTPDGDVVTATVSELSSSTLSFYVNTGLFIAESTYKR